MTLRWVDVTLLLCFCPVSCHRHNNSFKVHPASMLQTTIKIKLLDKIGIDFNFFFLAEDFCCYLFLLSIIYTHCCTVVCLVALTTFSLCINDVVLADYELPFHISVNRAHACNHALLNIMCWWEGKCVIFHDSDFPHPGLFTVMFRVIGPSDEQQHLCVAEGGGGDWQWCSGLPPLKHFMILRRLAERW